MTAPTTHPLTNRLTLIGGGLVVAALALPALAWAVGDREPLTAPKPDSAVTTAAVTDDAASQKADGAEERVDWANLTDREWRKRLTRAQYRVLREEGTERAGTSRFTHSKAEGTYVCGGCGAALFDSATKFDSGTGWPSFYQPVDGVKGDAVGERVDRKFFMTRTEVHCERCDGHLGHVFDDGPAPTGLRYCINGISLKFDPADGESDGE